MVKQKNKQKQQGYTLVELALVLAVIGVLIGSMTLGRELIEDAKVKSIMNDFKNFKQAHYLYIKRTGRPPGLLQNAHGDFSGIWGRAGDIRFDKEYFDDLIAEGFMVDRDPGKDVTVHSYGGDWFVSSKKRHYALFEGPQICARGLPIWVAKEIDIKWDDGHPGTGRVLTGWKFDRDALTDTYVELADEWGSKFEFTVCRAF